MPWGSSGDTLPPRCFSARRSTVVVEIQPITGTILEACRISGLSRPTLYRLLGVRKIKAVKCGSRTLIRLDSLREYLDSLPPASIRPERGRSFGEKVRP